MTRRGVGRASYAAGTKFARSHSSKTTTQRSAAKPRFWGWRIVGGRNALETSLCTHFPLLFRTLKFAGSRSPHSNNFFIQVRNAQFQAVCLGSLSPYISNSSGMSRTQLSIMSPSVNLLDGCSIRVAEAPIGFLARLCTQLRDCCCQPYALALSNCYTRVL